MSNLYISKTDNTEPNPNAQKYSDPGTTLYNADGFSSAMPKLVQGAAYLTLDRVLTISIFFKAEAGHDRIVNITDNKKNENPIVEFKNVGEVSVKYKNFNKRKSSNIVLHLHFASGYIKSISLTVPGFNSAVSDANITATSLLSISPYSNMLSIMGDSNASTTILTTVNKILDPYDVFKYDGIISSDLPFYYYINSESLNESFVEAGISSSNKNVDNGISTRGVGSLYTGPEEQEVHFINLLTSTSENSGIENKSDVINSLNSHSFTYGFLFGKNLYDIPDGSPTFYVCMDEGQTSYYKTSAKDCNDVAIHSKYLTGRPPARFLDGQCCNTLCDDFTLEVFNTTDEGADLNNDEGSVKFVVSGGTADYNLSLTTVGNSDARPAKYEKTIGTSETEYEFTGIGLADIGEYPMVATATDANGCSKTIYIQLNAENTSSRGLKLGCTDANAINYDFTADSNSGCYFCLNLGARGQKYAAIGFGDSSDSARELGIELITLQHSEITHTHRNGSTDGAISFRGELMSDAVPTVSLDSDASYRLRLFSLGKGENANQITKAEILALTPTATSTSSTVSPYEFTGLGQGWYAIAADIQNVPVVNDCISVYRFKVGHGGCTDKTANNYDPGAVYTKSNHSSVICTYDCDEETETITIRDTEDPCTKTVSISAGPSRGARNSFETISWVVGNKTYTGPGPHLAIAEDYVTVTRENSKTGCSTNGEVYIDPLSCNTPMTARSFYGETENWLNGGGCTDELAVNYDCDAEYDNGTCIEPIYGCTQASALNYNLNANIDDGTCVEGVIGCCDPASPNYNPLATYCAGCSTVSGSMASSFGVAEFSAFHIVKAGPGCPTSQGTINVNATDDRVEFIIGLMCEDSGWVRIPPGMVLRAYMIPIGGLTIEGKSAHTDISFPMAESSWPVAAQWTLTGDNYIPNILGTNTETVGDWEGGLGVDSGQCEFYNCDPDATGNLDYDSEGGLFGELSGQPWMSAILLNSADFGTIGYGGYIFELEIPGSAGKNYARTWLNSPHRPSYESGGNCDIVINSGNYAGVEGVAGSNIVGCLDENAFNYAPTANLNTYMAYNVGYGNSGGSSIFDYLPNPNQNQFLLSTNISSTLGLFTSLGNTYSTWADNHTCSYHWSGDQGNSIPTAANELYRPFMGTPCIPTNMYELPTLRWNYAIEAYELKKSVGKLNYIERCLNNGLINWYNNLITGRSEWCETKDLMIMSMIQYLLSRMGLECIYNCADSATPDFSTHETCEERWETAGSQEITYDDTSGVGDQDVWENTYFMVTDYSPMMGDSAPNTIWTTTRMSPDSGASGASLVITGLSQTANENFSPNPYGIQAKSSFVKCHNQKIITDNVNYLDKFFKFASTYCKSCGPCSYVPGNVNKFISTNITVNDVISDSTVSDSNLSVGGLNIQIDYENIN